jgi:hypothetical protein
MVCTPEASLSFICLRCELLVFLRPPVALPSCPTATAPHLSPDELAHLGDDSRVVATRGSRKKRITSSRRFAL